MKNININNFLTPVRSNTNYTMYRLGATHNTNSYIIVNRNGDVVTTGKRKHVIEVWNNVGTSWLRPMSESV